MVTNDSGQVLEAYDYYPFGLEMPSRSKGEALTCEQFTGQLRDNEAGFNLDYFGARYYDPAIGRFPSVDPILYQTELSQLFDIHNGKHFSYSPYVYTFNNPLKYVDPDGRNPWPSLNRYNPVAQLRGMWNRAVRSVTHDAPASAKAQAVSVVKECPSALDKATVGLAGTSVIAAGVAVATGPEPVSTIGAGTVAGVTAKGALVTEGTALFLTGIDAFVLGGDVSDVYQRAERLCRTEFFS